MTDNDEKEICRRLWETASTFVKSMGRREHVFEPAPDRSALVVVDMQNFVCSPRNGKGFPGLEQVISRVNSLADFCHDRKIPVIWLRQNFTRINGKDDSGLYSAFHVAPMSQGMFNQARDTEIFSGMHVDPALDRVVLKNRYSAFAPGSSCLGGLLTQMNKNQLLLCGLATNVCLESTVRDAMQHGYEVIVAGDAAASFNELLHAASLATIKLFFGDIRTTGDILKLWG